MIRAFVKFAVDKNVLNHIFLIFLIVLAVFSYNQIPKEIFPPSNLDAISITGSYTGTSPDVLDKIAVKNIEDDIVNLTDIDRIESDIINGAFNIVVYLKSGANRGEILDDIKDVISSRRTDLPSDMDEPVAKILTTTYPLVSIAIASKNSSKSKMLEVANEIKSKLSKIEDLSDISIRGDSDRELVFKIDDKKLSAYGIATSEFATALASLSEVFPVGIIKQKGDHLFISTYAGEKDIDKLNNTILNISGKKIYLKDLANAEFTYADVTELSHFDGKPNLSISINKAKTGNAIALVKDIKKILKTYEKKYTDLTFKTYSDSSIWIRNRLNTVISNIIFGLILVGFSVWIFISGRIAFVVTLGIPVSFMIGLVAAEFIGYSLNMLSLLGALIALGMLVDEAIVVAENIYRHLEKGDSPREAAINGSVEMFPAVLTATITTVCAFLPLLIMSGEMGVFMRLLPIMISILLISSLFEAFYFLPLHAKDFLVVKNKTKKNESFWLVLNDRYSKILNFLLHHQKVVLSLFLIVVISSIVVLGKKSKFQLFPDFDTTQIYVSGKVNINNDIEDTQKIVNKIEKILLTKLEDDDISSIASVSGFMLDAKYEPHVAENNFHIFIDLHDRVAENVFNKYINPYLSPEYDDSDMIRNRSANEVLEEIKKYTLELSKNGEFEEFRAIVPGAGIVSSDVEIALSGGDNKLIKKAVDKLTLAMKKEKGVFNVDNDLKLGKKELKLRVNQYGQVLGFNEKIISSILRPYFFKAEVSKMFYNGELIKIRSQEKMKDTYESISTFYVNIPGSQKKVRLNEVVDFEFKDGYSNIYKDGGVRISSVFGSLKKAEITSNELLAKLEPLLDEFRKEGLNVIIKGEAQENEKIQEEMGKAAVIAIFLIFLALIWMFDSVILSVILLTTIPLSLLGVLGGHIIMGLNLTMPGLLGIVGLSGVVVNDGIIMMDFIKKATSIKDIVKFATMRLRPILLTSITTILGLSTLIFFAAGQAVILQPMAVSLGFGLAWATVLNLLYLPVLYTIVKGRKLDAN
ncbi:efflux RND transporter permease subunit [Sulfurospirillum arcachonense]|uniref:efflux RND transporter permease subunit n=1 Tax=Sulfurospirillum arcachonense TaxID=57666 RepID=UPI0004689223|nr:efflux RND transporter permease subunit [Sulfurospirillum arcachonense]